MTLELVNYLKTLLEFATQKRVYLNYVATDLEAKDIFLILEEGKSTYNDYDLKTNVVEKKEFNIIFFTDLFEKNQSELYELKDYVVSILRNKLKMVKFSKGTVIKVLNVSETFKGLTASKKRPALEVKFELLIDRTCS